MLVIHQDCKKVNRLCALTVSSMTAEVFWDITPKNYVFLGFFLCGRVFVVVLGGVLLFNSKICFYGS